MRAGSYLFSTLLLCIELKKCIPRLPPLRKAWKDKESDGKEMGIGGRLLRGRLSVFPPMRAYFGRNVPGLRDVVSAPTTARGHADHGAHHGMVGGDPFRLTWYPAGSAPRRRARARRSCQRTRSHGHADHHAHHGLVGIDPPGEPASPPVMRAKTWRRNAGRCIIGQRAYQRGKLHSFPAETSQGKCKSAFLQNTPSVVKTTRVSNTTRDARTNRFLYGREPVPVACR
jgi:hypothetical protein